MRNHAVALGDDGGQPRTVLSFCRSIVRASSSKSFANCAGLGPPLSRRMPHCQPGATAASSTSPATVRRRRLHQQPQPVDLAEDGRRILTAGVDALHDLHDFGLDRRAQQDGLFSTSSSTAGSPSATASSRLVIERQRLHPGSPRSGPRPLPEMNLHELRLCLALERTILDLHGELIRAPVAPFGLVPTSALHGSSTSSR